MDPSAPLLAPQHHPQQQQQQSAPSAAPPQIRSRITVVCAECKRLKLKCDRRTPCGSCTKRDTVARCVYSPAAAEKVDLHSLNNRLILVESALAQLAAFSPVSSLSSFSRGNGNGGGGGGGDKVILAGSALTVSLKDVGTIWLNDLDLDKSIYPSPQFSTVTSPSSSTSPTSAHAHHIARPSAYSLPSPVKLEPTQVPLLPTPTHSHSSDQDGEEGMASLLLPPLTIYQTTHCPTLTPSPSSSSNGSSCSPVPFPSSPHSQHSISPALLALLPSAPYRRSLLDAVHRIMLLRPSFNFLHFRSRVERLFEGENSVGWDGNTRSKAANARAIFFGPPPPSPTSPRTSRTPLSSSSAAPPPTISFFAAVAAMFALGTLISSSGKRGGESNGWDDVDESFMNVDDDSGARRRRASHKSRPKSGSGGGAIGGKPSAAYLYALSLQALTVHEARAPFDLDYLIACLLQVVFLLQGGEGAGRRMKSREGNGGAGGALFPLVGKMVNIARQIGLATDPDDSPGRFSLFEAETRRRVWWDVFYYDLFVSDSQGHPPLISDNSYSTRMPANLDELAFSPSSSVLPVVDEAEVGWNVNGFKYFELKCKLAQLVKTIKRRICAQDFSYTLDHAAGLEADIKTWLENLPPPWRLGMDGNSFEEGQDEADRQVLVAQRCELAITAQRLVLRLYIPFLLQSSTNSTPTSPTSMGMVPHQASHGTVHAAHLMMHACRVLHAWRRRATVAVAPAVFDFNTFGRTVFDAVVICAHAAIKQPTAVWAGVALEDVGCALEVLNDVVAGRGVGRAGAGDLPVEEAVKIVEALKKKAEAARESGVGGGAVWMGTKRKHGEVEGELGAAPDIMGGLQFSFVSPPMQATPKVVSPVMQQQHRDRLASPRIPIPPVRTKYETPKVGGESGGPNEKDRDLEKEIERKEKEKRTKKAHYPPVGIRIRPGKEGSPLIRQRAGSGSTTATSSSGDGQMPVPQSLQSPFPGLRRKSIPSHPPTPVQGEVGFHQQQQQQQTIGHDMTQDSSSIYHSTATSSQDNPMPLSISTQETTPNASMDYSLSFGGEGAPMNMEVLQRRRFSIHDIGPHPTQPQPQQQQYPNFSTGTPGMYDQTQGGNFERSRTATFDSPSYDHSHNKSYTASSSSYGAGPASTEQSSDSGPSFSNGTGSVGTLPSSLPSGNFGAGPGLSHHPNPPPFGSLANSGGEGYYMQTGYEADYDSGALHGHAQTLVGLGMSATTGSAAHPMSSLQNMSSSSGASHYDKTPQPVYEMKTPEHHHSRTMQGQSQYQVNHGADPSRPHHSSHGLSLAPPPQSWSQATPVGNGDDYWSRPDYKYYS